MRERGRKGREGREEREMVRTVLNIESRAAVEDCWVLGIPRIPLIALNENPEQNTESNGRIVMQCTVPYNF